MTSEEFVQNIKPEKVTYNDMGTVYTTYEYTEQQLIDAFNAGKVEANRWHNLVENPNDLPKVEMNSVLLKLIANNRISYTVGVYSNYGDYGGWKFDFRCPDNLDFEIIAWKEIE